MKMNMSRLPIIAMAMSLPTVGYAQQVVSTSPPALVQVPLVSIPNSRQLDFTSKVNGLKYRIQISIPIIPPPSDGYATIYVLDGPQFFASFTEATRLRSLGGELRPAVIVGISYPDTPSIIAYGVRRTLDLTPTIDAKASEMLKAAYGVAPETGGADRFFQVIESEIKPRVAAEVKIDPAQTSLFGHSFGGLFALHVLFNHASSFANYLSLSPSIWWDSRAVLRNEASYGRGISKGVSVPRLFIGVGAGEQARQSRFNPSGSSTAAADTYLMVDNAMALSGRLRTLNQEAGNDIKSKVYEGRSHVGVSWAALDDVLDFALAVKR